jgi:hypothetical protein
VQFCARGCKEALQHGEELHRTARKQQQQHVGKQPRGDFGLVDAVDAIRVDVEQTE